MESKTLSCCPGLPCNRIESPQTVSLSRIRFGLEANSMILGTFTELFGFHRVRPSAVINLPSPHNLEATRHRESPANNCIDLVGFADSARNMRSRLFFLNNLHAVGPGIRSMPSTTETCNTVPETLSVLIPLGHMKSLSFSGRTKAWCCKAICIDLDDESTTGRNITAASGGNPAMTPASVRTLQLPSSRFSLNDAFPTCSMENISGGVP